MLFKDEPNPHEEAYDVPMNTIEPAWRFFTNQYLWCFKMATAGVPIAIRYRKAENRISVIDGIKERRRMFYNEHPSVDGHLKINARFPYMVIIMLRNAHEPEILNELNVVNEMEYFSSWHRANFQGSGRHLDPSVPNPET